jgi:hypothetical protein
MSSNRDGKRQRLAKQQRIASSEWSNGGDVRAAISRNENGGEGRIARGEGRIARGERRFALKGLKRR